MRHLQGYSLLEILIVLTIISILGVTAVPAYLNYDVRAKVSEGLSLSEPVKVAVMDYFLSTGSWPDSNEVAGVDAPGSFKTDNVKTISVDKDDTSSYITITYNIPALASSNTIILTPVDPSTNVTQWKCNQGTMLIRYRPSACRS